MGPGRFTLLPSLQKIIALAKLIEHEPGVLSSEHGIADPVPTPRGVRLRQPNEHAQPIPKTIVQFWDSPDIPPDIARLMESWGRCEGFEHQIFADTIFGRI